MPTHLSATSRHHPLRQRRRQLKIPLGAQRFLAAFEGIEGGFAIGASIVVALVLSGLNHRVVIITAIITIVVNGFNNASVKYSSEHYLDELDGREKRSSFRHYFVPALIEFVSYFAISFIAIIPLIVLGESTGAIMWCVAVTLVLLACAGYWRAYMLRMPRWRDALETTLLGAGIIAIGALSGWLLQAM